MNEYEISLVTEAKKGKKKALDRLYDSFHKQLSDLVERETGDKSRCETILHAAFEKAKTEIKTLTDPAGFEALITNLVLAECGQAPRRAPGAFTPTGAATGSSFSVSTNTSSIVAGAGSHESLSLNDAAAPFLPLPLPRRLRSLRRIRTKEPMIFTPPLSVPLFLPLNLRLSSNAS